MQARLATGLLCLAGTPDGGPRPTEDMPMPVSYQGLLSGLLALTEQTYAPYPVWSGSTTKPIQFTPLPKKAALRLWQYARDFDRQTKEKGRHGGAVGHTGLKVLQVLIFDFLNFAS